jgi:hypothetical protein
MFSNGNSFSSGDTYGNDARGEAPLFRWLSPWPLAPLS